MDFDIVKGQWKFALSSRNDVTLETAFRFAAPARVAGIKQSIDERAHLVNLAPKFHRNSKDSFSWTPATYHLMRMDARCRTYLP